MPETEKTQTGNTLTLNDDFQYSNLIDAITTGASEGLKLALNVAAMLLSFIALIALLNGLLSFGGELVGIKNFTLELILGYFFSPVAFLLGVEWQDTQMVGALLGKKLVLNEFVAYTDLQTLQGKMSERSNIITTYALCGFSNFSSIAIQVGGIGTLAEDRRKDLSSLGFLSLVGGTLACLMTACIAGIFL